MAFFLRRVQSYAEAEDLTQEVFARLLVGKGTTDQPDVYVFRVAQNLLVDRVRKLMVRQRYREAALTEPERDLDVLDPHSIAASREELAAFRSEEHTSELQSLMRNSYAVFCLKTKKTL